MTVAWERGDAAFTRGRYSRAHTWAFDGGVTVPASSSPHVVRVPFSDPANVDPEEAYVAALASCHMLWFLDLTAQGGFVVELYRDEPVGVMGKNEAGQEVMTRSHCAARGLRRLTGAQRRRRGCTAPPGAPVVLPGQFGEDGDRDPGDLGHPGRPERHLLMRPVRSSGRPHVLGAPGA